MTPPFLRVRDRRDQRILEFERAEVRIGRDPDIELVITGSGAEVVSALHARLVHRDGAWMVEDAGSRNGTFLDGRRLQSSGAAKLVSGAVIRLGSRGPEFTVEAVERRKVAATLAEGPALARPSAATVPMDVVDASPTPSAPPPAAAPPPPPPPPAPKPSEITLTVRDRRTGARHEARAGRIRIGRGKECELRPVSPDDTTVSRVHCEIVLRPDGKVTLRDLRSRNGTLVNGRLITGDHALAVGDTIKLGEAGPELEVETLTAPESAGPTPPPEPKRAEPAPAPAPEEKGATPAAAPRRSFGGKGRTVFFKEAIAESESRSRSRVRIVVWSFVALLVASVGGVWWYSEQRVQQTEAQLAAQSAQLTAQQRISDSMRAAAQGEYDRLRSELDSARSQSAPAAVVDSLRRAVAGAEQHTQALESSLKRAQHALTSQLSAGDSLRKAAQADIARLQHQLQQSSTSQTSSGALDSLRAAVREAEQRAQDVAARVRAVRGSDLAGVAQANQAAVGMVSTFAGKDIWDGSGFVVTPSGYFITNRHVVQPEGHTADSVFVTMADHKTMSHADIIAISQAPGPDLAVIKIRHYKGPHIQHVDWDDKDVTQGEPAALIGFPQGVAMALDGTRTVRTSMSGGIFSKVTPDLIQFAGFTVQGSSGSPVFNANGEVVSVHAAGLKEAAGMAFTIPVRLVLPILPSEARKELGH